MRILLSLIFSLFFGCVNAQSYWLVGTKNYFTICPSDDLGYITWNGTDKANDIAYAKSIPNDGRQLNEYTGRKRIAIISLYEPSDNAYVESVGKYKRLIDGRTFDIVSYSPFSLVGRWNIKMTVTECNCNNHYIGEELSEMWRISNDSQSDDFIITVSDNANGTDSGYKATFDGFILQVSAKSSNLFAATVTDATLRMTNASILTGVRRIMRSKPCVIKYSLKAQKL